MATPDAGGGPDAAPRAAASRPGRKRDHSRDAEILEATIDVLAEAGYDGMTIDMVAARARAGKATLYRRWSSKEELVLEAVGCLKRPEAVPPPDTGTLRGDLVALVKPHSMEDGERKLQVMAGVVSMLSRAPQLADAVHQALVAPRAELNRVLMRRAIERGEIAPDVDIDTISMITPAMVAYRVLLLRKPVDRAFLVGLIDDVLLPAVGLGRAAAGA